jgi:hypothetical protein
MWITDTLKTMSAKFIGRSMYGYDNYVYELPYSKTRITVMKNERWTAEGRFANVLDGEGRNSLWDAYWPIECQIKAEWDQQSKVAGDKNFADAMDAIEAVRKQAEEYDGEPATIRVADQPGVRFPDVSIRTYRDQVYVSFVNLDTRETPNSESGKIQEGYLYNQSFKGLRGLKMAAKKRFDAA